MAIAFVQEVVAAATPVNATSLVLTLSGVTTTVGNLLVLGTASRSGAVSTVTDSKGNTWQVDVATSATSTAGEIVTCVLTSALVNGDTITISYGGGTSGHAASVAEYSGVVSSSWLDKTTAASATTGTASDSTATATTAQADELLIGVTGIASSHSAFAPESLSPAWNENTTAASSGSVQTVRPMYRIVSATGTYSAKATWTTSRQWSALIATYKAAADASPLDPFGAAGFFGA